MALFSPSETDKHQRKARRALPGWTARGVTAGSPALDDMPQVRCRSERPRLQPRWAPKRSRWAPRGGP
eukprot:791317-Pyramimonas_sp.AAC.1